MRPEVTAYSIPAVLIAISILLAGIAWTIPAYSDPEWDKEFLSVDVSVENTRDPSKRWYSAKAAAQTPRNDLVDLSIGILGLAISTATLFQLKSVNVVSDLWSLSTPGSRRNFLVAATLAWCSFVPAQWVALSFEVSRGDFPWWADSIAIPGYQILIAVVVGLPIVLAGVQLALWRSELPRSLWSRPIVGRPLPISLGLCVLSSVFLFLLVGTVRGDPFSVPSIFAMTYLLLSGRATCLANGPHNNRMQTDEPWPSP